MRLLPAVPLLAALALGAASTPVAGQGATPANCDAWQDCQRLALDAAARGDYEAFHDLAWRAVQTGPPRDPDLMYLLARAQSLSGRPHDALVMLRRLAEMGVSTDAASQDDFRRVRNLPGWRALEALLAGAPEAATATTLIAQPIVGGRATTESVMPLRPALPPRATATPDAADATALESDGSEGPASSTAIAADSAADPAAPSPATSAVEEALRFAGDAFVPGGLAYDAVSGRFIVGNLLARKVMVVGEGRTYSIDLVRADSAGFADVMALEIDTKRGDLWIVSTGQREPDTFDPAAEPLATLHKIQLISGRPLGALHLAAEDRPGRFTDLAVMETGAVIVLDSEQGRLFVARPKSTTLDRLLKLDLREPRSLATGRTGHVYVAHQDGIARIDIATRAVEPVGAPDGVSLQRIERIRWHAGSLIGVQVTPEGARRLVRLALNRSGRAVVELEPIEGELPPEGEPTFVTVAGDDLYYLAREREGKVDETGSVVETIVRRVRLR